MSRKKALDPSKRYLHIEPKGVAFDFEAPDDFWPQLISRQNMSDEVARVAKGGGWLMVKMHMTADPAHWEMHPAGDELLIVLSGELHVNLEMPEGLEVVEATAGTICKVPRGVWHRAHVVEPAELIAMTYGEGTQHRP